MHEIARQAAGNAFRAPILGDVGLEIGAETDYFIGIPRHRPGIAVDPGQIIIDALLVHILPTASPNIWQGHLRHRHWKHLQRSPADAPRTYRTLQPYNSTGKTRFRCTLSPVILRTYDLPLPRNPQLLYRSRRLRHRPHIPTVSATPPPTPNFFVNHIVRITINFALHLGVIRLRTIFVVGRLELGQTLVDCHVFVFFHI